MLKKSLLNFLLLFTLFIGFNIVQLKAQGGSTILGQDTSSRPILTAVPFLAITPDARAGAMGDVGVATSPDANSIYWNMAKMAFVDKRAGFALSYNPWLRNLVNDMSLSYLTGFFRPDDRQAFAFEFRYFNLGEFEFTDQAGAVFSNPRLQELCFGLAYSIKLSNNFGVGVGGRFIYSNLGSVAADPSGNEIDARPGIGGSADISAYYNNKNLKVNGLPATLSFGLNVSNIGPKISYLGRGTGDFIPTNMRLGSAFTVSLDPLEKNKLTLALDFNKLMVPTPPQRDRRGNITRGRDPRSVTLIDGIFGSFADAPDGFSEELREFSIGTGAEYAYDNVFFARAGYFTEHRTKGARKYFSIGAGFNYRQFGLDVAYLIPQAQQNPLAETLRFALKLNFTDTNSKVEGVEVN
ncbi:MAG: type IX secretion system outer membrane channel protein PorV [Microscillaceae bacterium]|jgi:hypothetical protein|nr:type IX secretion system outer membrane channel protein PorV [Microscillaceae bacterium]